VKKEIQMYLIASSYVLVYYLIIVYFEQINPLVHYTQLMFFGTIFGITIVTHIIIPLILFRFVYLRERNKSKIAKKITVPGLFILLLIINNILLNLMFTTHTEISNHYALQKVFPQGLDVLKEEMKEELIKLEGEKIEIIKFNEERPYYSSKNTNNSSGVRSEMSISIIYKKNNTELYYQKFFSMQTGKVIKTLGSVKKAEERLKENEIDLSNKEIALDNLMSNTFLMDGKQMVKFTFEESGREYFDYKMIMTNVENNSIVMEAYVDHISMDGKDINEFSFEIKEYKNRPVEYLGTFYVLVPEIELFINDARDKIKLEYIDAK
jgi:hypothetical protein